MAETKYKRGIQCVHCEKIFECKGVIDVKSCLFYTPKKDDADKKEADNGERQTTQS